MSGSRSCKILSFITKEGILYENKEGGDKFELVSWKFNDVPVSFDMSNLATIGGVGGGQILNISQDYDNSIKYFQKAHDYADLETINSQLVEKNQKQIQELENNIKSKEAELANYNFSDDQIGKNSSNQVLNEDINTLKLAINTNQDIIKNNQAQILINNQQIAQKQTIINNLGFSNDDIGITKTDNELTYDIENLKLAINTNQDIIKNNQAQIVTNNQQIIQKQTIINNSGFDEATIGINKSNSELLTDIEKLKAIKSETVIGRVKVNLAFDSNAQSGTSEVKNIEVYDSNLEQDIARVKDLIDAKQAQLDINGLNQYNENLTTNIQLLTSQNQVNTNLVSAKQALLDIHGLNIYNDNLNKNIELKNAEIIQNTNLIEAKNKEIEINNLESEKTSLFDQIRDMVNTPNPTLTIMQTVGVVSGFSFIGALLGPIAIFVIKKISRVLINKFHRFIYPHKILLFRQKRERIYVKKMAITGAIASTLIGSVKGGLVGFAFGYLGMIFGIIIGCVLGFTAGFFGGYLSGYILKLFYKRT